MKKFILALFLTLNLFSFAQESNFTIKVHETLLNSFFQKLGTIKGKEKLYLMGIKQSLKWELNDVKIDINNKNIRILASNKVKFQGNTFTTKLSGDIKLALNKDKTAILLKVYNAKISGLDFLDISSIYKPVFTYPIRNNFKELIKFSLPDSSQKEMTMIYQNKNISFENDNIIVDSYIDFE